MRLDSSLVIGLKEKLQIQGQYHGVHFLTKKQSTREIHKRLWLSITTN